MTTDTTATRPAWALRVAIGFWIAGIGVLLFGIGMLLVNPLATLGVLVFAVGAAIALIGGASYFLGIRR
jgi:hypothetical protein